MARRNPRLFCVVNLAVQKFGILPFYFCRRKQHANHLKLHKMNTRNHDLRSLRKELRAARRDIARMRGMMEIENRLDNLIKEMQRSAREMLIMSREL